MRKTGILLAAMVAVGLMLPMNRAAAADCDGMEAKIAAAKTAADHEAIAGCYDQMATDAKAKADEHKKMAAAYKGVSAATKMGMPQHCSYFTKTFEAEAKNYEAMAAAHRKMAKSAK